MTRTVAESYQTMQVMHSFYIHEEATAVLVRPLDMSISQSTLEPFFSRNNARSSCVETCVSYCREVRTRVVYRTVDSELVPGIINLRRSPLSVDGLLQERAIIMDKIVFYSHFLKQGSCRVCVRSIRPRNIRCFKFWTHNIASCGRNRPRQDSASRSRSQNSRWRCCTLMPREPQQWCTSTTTWKTWNGLQQAQNRRHQSRSSCCIGALSTAATHLDSPRASRARIRDSFDPW